MTKAFPAESFNSIAGYRRLDTTFGDRQTQTGVGQIIVTTQQSQVFVANLARAVKDPFKLGWSEESLVPSKGPGVHGRLAPRDYAESTLRPLARRALKILRPAAVAIRARKPCLRARFKLLG